jgi:protein-S-isoprenylcysteine O-methyltransferase Ste14
MNEMTRRIYAGVFIYLAVVIRFAYQARTGRRKMEMVQHLPVARGAATVSSWSWFALLMAVPVPGLVPLDDLPIATAWRVPLQVAGAAILAMSIGLFYWCHRALGEFWYGEPGLKQGHQLIRRGPYRWVRHPMYTSFFGGYLGALLLLQSWVFFIPIAFAPGFWFMAVVEERILTGQFGADYGSYRRQAGRFLPRLARSET